MSHRRLVGSGLLLCLLATASAAGAQEKVESIEKRRTIQVTFGQVISVEPEKVASQAGSGAVLGGILGAAATHGKNKDKIKGAAAGALIGALLTRASEGSHKTWGVTLKRTDGSVVKVIQDHVEGIQPGSCVAFEEGVHANVRLVSRELCGNPALAGDSTIVAAVTQDGDLCHLAKEALANARSKEEFELAMQKIRVLCH
jgi:outer membrane lipoprotein SlyB